MNIDFMASVYERFHNPLYLPAIGQTTVVKTIIIHKLIHVFISLPNPRKEVLWSLCWDFLKFIWKSKETKKRIHYF